MFVSTGSLWLLSQDINEYTCEFNRLLSFSLKYQYRNNQTSVAMFISTECLKTNKPQQEQMVLNQWVLFEIFSRLFFFSNYLRTHWKQIGFVQFCEKNKTLSCHDWFQCLRTSCNLFWSEKENNIHSATRRFLMFWHGVVVFFFRIDYLDSSCLALSKNIDDRYTHRLPRVRSREECVAKTKKSIRLNDDLIERKLFKRSFLNQSATISIDRRNCLPSSTTTTTTPTMVIQKTFLDRHEYTRIIIQVSHLVNVAHRRIDEIPSNADKQSEQSRFVSL